MTRLATLFIALFLLFRLEAQTERTASVFGTVKDGGNDQPIELVTVYIQNSTVAVETDVSGNYTIDVPPGQLFRLVFTRIGYKEASIELSPMLPGSRRRVDVVLANISSDIEVIVTESRIEDQGMIREGVTDLKLLPTTTGNLESVLPHIALGTNSGTGGELSSQYQVRGGNYDENLVYVNDFEIYRPQLIRSGQQEGLTFANIDLIRDLSFSSGGFEAKYGDKLSSVLDIHYKRPDSLSASVGMSFLGGSAHVEGSLRAGKTEYQRLRYLVGARYKTTKYLLGSLDTRGEYAPNFTDVQAYLTYDINRDWQIGLLGNFNSSIYEFEPVERSTGLGLINLALQLTTVFEGQEVDDFTTAMGGLSLTYLPDRVRNPFFLKFLASAYASDENERFDIIGDYLLAQVESDLGSDGFGDIIGVLGTGTQHQFARNYLHSNVTNFQHKGGIELQGQHREASVTSSNFIQWGTKLQIEDIDDEINEWERLDSAGYSLNFDENQVLLKSVLKTRNNLRSTRISAFFQDTYTLRRDSLGELRVTAGLRASYWDLNREFILSPRIQMLYKPLNTDKDLSYRLAAGLYYQPPFYREMRNPKGEVNTDLLSQKAFHIVGGFTWDFYFGKRNPKTFRFIAEAYYKHLWDLVSYEVDNVRIRYSGLNDATGYVMGFDMRLNGEFVPGAESWINLSLLRAREQIVGIQHLRREFGAEEAQTVDDVPRPTDQLVTLSFFFQDYLPKNENFKMHLNFTVGSGLPYGLLGNNRIYRNSYRFNPYHRVDIGFSILLWNKGWLDRKPQHPLRFTKNTWLSLEVFNLMRIANAASNTWIKAINNVQYRIPNFLTSRRVNLRLKMDF